MNSHQLGRRLIPHTALCAACLAGANLYGQEALEGYAQVDRGRAARKQAIDRNLYNLKAGPVLMRFDALMGFEFNDNPQLVEHPDEVDFAFHPQADMAALWALNARNALALNIGVGYIKYINNTDLDHVIIAPSSELAFDIYTGDVAINVHERVSHEQNPVSDPSVSGTGDFGGIENTAGLRVDWNLNQFVFSAGYDHYNFISTGSGIKRTATNNVGVIRRLSDVQDRASDLFYGRAAIKATPGLTTGLEASGGLTDYESDFFHDNTQYSVGAFAEVEVSRDLKGRVAGGYLHSDFDDAGFSRAPDAVDDFYAEISAEHQLNQYMNHRLALGREARAGAESELITLYYVRYQNNWSLSRLLTLQTTAFYENGKERSGVTERFWRVGAGAGVVVPITRQFNSSLAYQLLYKDSDQANRDYLQNLVTLEFRYVF